MKALRDNQGFYIYRNNRLIIYGTWFRLSQDNISSELFKYGRIKVDIPNSLDDIWDIDIKKQNANIPKSLINNLRNIVYKVRSRSRQKNEKRSRLKYEEDNSLLWNKVKNVDTNKANYFINTNSAFIKEYIEEFDEYTQKRIVRLLEIISSKIPLDDIYNSIANNNCDNYSNQSLNDGLIQDGVLLFDKLKKVHQKDDQFILDLMFKIEPFNNVSLINAIRERVCHD